MQKQYTYHSVMRISDKKSMFGIKVRYICNNDDDEYKLDDWIMVDCVSYIVLDCVKDWETITKEEKDNLDHPVEDGVLYITYPQIDINYAENMVKRLSNIADNFSEEIWVETRNMLSNQQQEPVDMPDITTQRQTEFYRYENFVLKKFKSNMIDKVVIVNSPKKDTKSFVMVSDVYIDFKDGMPYLGVSGNTIRVSLTDNSYSLSFNKAEPNMDDKKSVMNFVGYLDELMLMSKDRIPQDFFAIASNPEEDIIPCVSSMFGKSQMSLNNFFNNVFFEKL